MLAQPSLFTSKATSMSYNNFAELVMPQPPRSPSGTAHRAPRAGEHFFLNLGQLQRRLKLTSQAADTLATVGYETWEILHAENPAGGVRHSALVSLRADA
jgi:hypothetical protein